MSVHFDDYRKVADQTLLSYHAWSMQNIAWPSTMTDGEQRVYFIQKFPPFPLTK